MSIVLGIARYERKMYWRRLGLRVLALTMALLLIMPIIFSQDEASKQALNESVLLITFPLLFTIFVFIAPVVNSDSLPLDQHYHTDELLRSTSMRFWHYALGKLFGLYSAMLSMAIPMMFAYMAVWALVQVQYDIGEYFLLWLMCLLLMFINGGVALLISGTQPNRIRSALLIVILWSLSFALIAATYENAHWWNYLDITHMAVITEMMFRNPMNVGEWLTSQASLLTWGFGVVQLGLSALVLYVWRMRIN